jgi:hypothetical protein
MRSQLFRVFAGLVVLACASATISAQSLGDISAIPRVYGPGGARIVNDEPFSHRYSYSVSPQLYFNGSARELWYQDYLDRLDRAERFGYCPPSGPRYSPAENHCRPRIFGGVGFGVFSH